jgi:hypothetical protein
MNISWSHLHSLSKWSFWLVLTVSSNFRKPLLENNSWNQLSNWRNHRCIISDDVILYLILVTHGGCLIRSRNYFSLASTWGSPPPPPRFWWGSCSLCSVLWFACLLCVPSNASVSALSNLDYPFSFRWHLCVTCNVELLSKPSTMRSCTSYPHASKMLTLTNS